MHIRSETPEGAAPDAEEADGGGAADRYLRRSRPRCVSITMFRMAVCLPFQDWVMVWLPGKVKCTIHPSTAVVGAPTVTARPGIRRTKLLVEYVAVQAPPAGGDSLPGGSGGVLVGGRLGGGVVGSGLGGGMVPSPTPVTSPLPPSKTTSEQP